MIPRLCYVLLYRELATRRIVWFGVTAKPDTAWVTQQSRNLVWKLDGSPTRFVIHDHDAKFAGPADAVFRAEGMEVIKTPIAAPKANAHIERQSGSGRRECLDWMLIIGRRHLERVMRDWIQHYNQSRPHRSLELKTPIARSDPSQPRLSSAANFVWEVSFASTRAPLSGRRPACQTMCLGPLRT